MLEQEGATTPLPRLTEEQKTAYLKNYGHCPFCRSDEIEGGFVEIDGNTAWQKVTCMECGRQWNDLYHLNDVEEADIR